MPQREDMYDESVDNAEFGTNVFENRSDTFIQNNENNAQHDSDYENHNFE